MRDENKENLIQNAINMLDDELILEADEIRHKSVKSVSEHSSNKKKRGLWRTITTLAASVAVFVIAGTVWNEVIVPNQTDESTVEQEVVSGKYDYPEGYQGVDSPSNERGEEMDTVAKTESLETFDNLGQTHLAEQKLESAAGVEELIRVKIPEMEVLLALPKDVQMDMLAFFIYEGRCYVQDRYYKDGISLVGDYVGTSVGLIDEWTKEDGYVDYAGSIAGDFYEVKGYDPEFILCMKLDNGAVETFIHNNGISLGKGAELIEDRLHLKDNVEKVTFKTQEEWDTSLQDENYHILAEEYEELMTQFLESFSSDDFVHIKDTPLERSENGNYHHNSTNYHITFHTKDGLQFEFALYEDGYTSFQGLNSVCVQIDPALYEEIIRVFQLEG